MIFLNFTLTHHNLAAMFLSIFITINIIIINVVFKNVLSYQFQMQNLRNLLLFFISISALFDFLFIINFC